MARSIPTSRAVPGVPGVRHAPAVTAAFARKGFTLAHTGGGHMGYHRTDPTIGEVLVSDEGELPPTLDAPVSLYVFGLQHSEHLLEMRFKSVRAFLATVRPQPGAQARPPAKRNGSGAHDYFASIRKAVAEGRSWHSEAMLPGGGSVMVHCTPKGTLAEGWSLSIDREDEADHAEAVRRLGRAAVEALIVRSVQSDLGMAGIHA